MKREPYILTEDMCIKDIADLIKRAYDEGYEDGKKEATTITFPGYGEITTPLKDIQITPNNPGTPWSPSITPNDWPPSVIYCGTPPKTYFDETTGSFKGTVCGDGISGKTSGDQ